MGRLSFIPAILGAVLVLVGFAVRLAKMRDEVDPSGRGQAWVIHMMAFIATTSILCHHIIVIREIKTVARVGASLATGLLLVALSLAVTTLPPLLVAGHWIKMKDDDTKSYAAETLSIIGFVLSLGSTITVHTLKTMGTRVVSRKSNILSLVATLLLFMSICMQLSQAKKDNVGGGATAWPTIAACILLIPLTLAGAYGESYRLTAFASLLASAAQFGGMIEFQQIENPGKENETGDKNHTFAAGLFFMMMGCWAVMAHGIILLKNHPEDEDESNGSVYDVGYSGMASGLDQVQSTPLSLSALMSNIPLMITAAFVPLSVVLFFVTLATNTFKGFPQPTKQTGVVVQLQAILSIVFLAVYQLTARGRHAPTHKTNGWFLAAAGSFGTLILLLVFQAGISGLKLEEVTRQKIPFHFTSFAIFVLLMVAFILALPIYGRGGHISHPPMIKLIMVLGVGVLVLSQVLGYIQVTKKIKDQATLTWASTTVQLVVPQWTTILALIGGAFSCNTLMQVWSISAGTTQFVANFTALITVANAQSTKGSGLLVGMAITGIIGVLLLDCVCIRNLYKKALRTTGIAGGSEHTGLAAPTSAHQGGSGPSYNALA